MFRDLTSRDLYLFPLLLGILVLKDFRAVELWFEGSKSRQVIEALDIGDFTYKGNGDFSSLGL